MPTIKMTTVVQAKAIQLKKPKEVEVHADPEAKKHDFMEFWDAAVRAAGGMIEETRMHWLRFFLETRREAVKSGEPVWEQCPDCGYHHYVRADGLSVHKLVSIKITERKNWSRDIIIPTPLGNEQRYKFESKNAARAETLKQMINE